jgi:hypothetical protein
MGKKEVKNKKKITKKTTIKKVVSSKPKSLPLIPSKKEVESAEFVDVLMEAFDKDEKQVSFYIAWIKHEGNSTKAYQELHPSVNDKVASVLGSRRLAKVREKVGINMLLCDFGLGIDLYMQKIKEGLNATNIDIIDIKVKDPNSKESKLVYEKVETPNHAVQKAYHDKLGKLLGIEDNTPNVAVQVNTNTNIIDNINDDDLNDLIS